MQLKYREDCWYYSLILPVSFPDELAYTDNFSFKNIYFKNNFSKMLLADFALVLFLQDSQYQEQKSDVKQS